MKTYSRQPETKSDIAQPKASQQASAHDVLQAYKGKIVQRQEIDEDELLQGKFGDAIQREEFGEDELLQGKFDTAQREGIDEDELLQGKFDASSTVQKEEATQSSTENRTGMPDNLKSGIESLSGFSMDDVRVHYNSSKPAQLQALAYAQGTDIHVAPGQEQHLPHEAWHVVQQKQGRVEPTMQLQGVNVNDNEGLEKEADVMGGKAGERSVVDSQSHVLKKVTSHIVQCISEEEIRGRAYYLWEKRKRINPDYNNPQKDYYDAKYELETKDKFKELVDGKDYLKAIELLNNTYFNGDKDYKLEVENHIKRSRHAATSGKGNNVKIKFNIPYIEQMADGSHEKFTKIIGTLRHEREHFKQRQDEDYTTNTTKEEREFLAYSEELLFSTELPELHGELRKKTYKKAKNQYEKLTPDLQAKYTLRKNEIDSLPH
nr:DUF4157 domain-containing protein [Dysgonomonas sp. ZJ279]